jgi:putative phage-type endonuclease
VAARLLMTDEEIRKDPARWLALRRAGVTASEISVILGIAPERWTFASPFALYHAKLRGIETGDADELRRGRHLEPVALEMFADQHPYLELLPGGLYSAEDRPWQMCTFDALAIDTDVLGLRMWEERDAYTLEHAVPVQVKTAASYDGWGEPGSDQIPAHYRAQAFQEMDIKGADMAWVPCLFVHTWQLVTYILQRDADAGHDISLIRAEGEAFHGRLQRGDEPPIDWRPATTDMLKTIHPVEEGLRVRVRAVTARRYLRARQSMTRAEQRLGLAVNLLLDEAGDAREIEAHVGGEPVKIATRSVSTPERIDTKALRLKDPATAAKYTVRRDKPVVTLHPAKWARQER